jgi:hypothetical protein
MMLCFKGTDVFETEGQFKKLFDSLLHNYGINRNGYWNDYTGGDVRLFLKIFQDKLHFWKKHKLTESLQQWDNVTIFHMTIFLKI